MSEIELRKFLDRAFSLGQTYWQQADSESYKQNKKADGTRLAFTDLKNLAVAALATPSEESKCKTY